MKATLTVTFDLDEDGVCTEIYARLKDLGVDVSRGDADGRRWLSIIGILDDSGLREIAMILENSN